MKPLERLYASPELENDQLPAALARLYGGGLGFRGARVYANFVSSLDGVVALPFLEASPSVVSDKSEADRLVMSLLRACADAVLIGAGTLRAEPGHRWTPEYIYPQATDDYTNLRAALGLAPEPMLVVVTSSGVLDPEIPALKGALLLTTASGARRLQGKRPIPATILKAGDEERLDFRTVIQTLRSRGMRTILSEGGPTVMGQLLELRLLNELFLTVSPVVMGRTSSDGRLGLAEGVDLLAHGRPKAEILSVHRHGSHLFLRYSLASSREARSAA
jgi:riboflavin biosynthesis pyrimidine reductase